MTTNYPAGVTVLTDHEEHLLRQIPEAVLQPNGVPMSTAFDVTELDEGMLSTLRGHVGPKLAFERWTGASPSAGTWAVSVGETNGIDLPAVDDSALENMPEDHASIDFNGVASGKKRKQKARMLRDLAEARGRLHPPID